MTQNNQLTAQDVRQICESVLKQHFGALVGTQTQVMLPKNIKLKEPNAFEGVFKGTLGISGGTAGAYGNEVVQAAAIAAPNAPGAAYLQADAASAVAAINSIRTALSNFGITA